jgi:hypothetical protein
MTKELMHRLVQKHAALEEKLDLEGVLATLIDEPIYEFHPARLRLTGKESVREFYREHFDAFFPLIAGHTIINECWDEHSACLEYDLKLKAPYDKQVFRIMVVLTEQSGLLVGERFYVNETLAKLMAGKAYGKFEKF